MILIYSTLYWTLPGPHPLQMPRILCPFAAARPACPVPPSRPPSGSRRRSLSAPLDPVGFRARISQALSLSFPAPPFSFLSYTSSFVCFFSHFFLSFSLRSPLSPFPSTSPFPSSPPISSSSLPVPLGPLSPFPFTTAGPTPPRFLLLLSPFCRRPRPVSSWREINISKEITIERNKQRPHRVHAPSPPFAPRLLSYSSTESYRA